MWTSRLLKNTHLMCGSKGEGLLTPQPCVFTLTARPGAFEVNRKQALADPASGQAALQRLGDGCCTAGLSDTVRGDAAVQEVPNNFVVAKKPPPPLSL